MNVATLMVSFGFPVRHAIFFYKHDAQQFKYLSMNSQTIYLPLFQKYFRFLVLILFVHFGFFGFHVRHVLGVQTVNRVVVTPSIDTVNVV